MKCVICEDNKEHLHLLQNHIHNYARNEEVRLEIGLYTSSASFAKQIGQPCDIVFLDVEMDGYSGIELAKMLRQHDKNKIMIFVTSYDKYAIEAFHVRAFHYLTKPVTYDNVKQAIDLAREKIESIREEKEFFASVNGAPILFLQKDILYFEKRRNKVAIIEHGRETVFYSTMKSVLSQVKSDLFVQINQGFIVNMSHIRMIKDKTVYISTGEALPISKHRLSEVKESYFQYIRKRS